PRARPHGDRPHIHVREPQQLARLGGDNHRDRAVPSPGDDSAAFERIEGEIDVDSPGADPLGSVFARLALDCAHNHPTGHRELRERAAHARGCRFLCALLVGAPEPAGAGERRTLGRAEIGDAEAQVGAPLRRGGDGDLLRLRHTDARRSAPLSTSSITVPIESSMLPFSTIGTPDARACSRMKFCSRRMSTIASRYFCTGRSPSECASRTQKWEVWRSASSIASTQCTTSAPSTGGSIPGTRWTPSRTSDQPSWSARSMTPRTPISTLRVCSTNPSTVPMP